MPRRRGQRPQLLAAVVRSGARSAFTAERQVVGQTRDMSKAPHQRALDILVHRCGEWSKVHLQDGKVCMAHDVGWGYDLGEEVAHITTNGSPGPDPDEDIEFSYEVDFFHANQITKIEDVETGAVLFDLTDD